MSKKKPYKNALITVAIAGALAAFTFLVLRPSKEAKEKAQAQAALLFGESDREKVFEIHLQNTDGNVQIKRKAAPSDSWYITNNEGKTFDADKTSVDGLLSTILAAKKEQVIAPTDPATVGLQPAKFRLMVSMAGNGSDSTKKEIWIGDDTPVDYFVYSKWSDQNEIFLTTRSLRFGIDKKFDDIRNKKVFDIKSPEYSSISFKIGAIDDKHPAQNLRFDRSEKGEWKAAIGPTLVTLDQAKLGELFNNLANLTVVNFASEKPADRNAKFGFSRPLATLVYTPSNAKNPTLTWALSKVKDKYYLARLDQDSTYEVAATFVDNLKINLNVFRPQNLVAIKKEQITSFVVQDGLQSAEFSRGADGKWTALAKTLKGESTTPAKTEYVEAALNSLTALKPDEFLDGRTPAQLGLQRPIRVVELRGPKLGKDHELLASLFFGRKLNEDKVVFRTEGMDAAASVVLKVDDILSLKPEAFSEKPAVAPATEKALENDVKPQGAKKVKLEATVKSTKEIQKLPAAITKPAHKYTAEILMNDGKKFVITFDAAKAPYTVSNFLHLARNHFYDGVKFHRVIADFVAQGGDPTGTGTGGPGYKFDNEDNDLRHVRGSISMAHAGRNTNGSQFFLVLKPQPHLDGLHTVFGLVTEGADKLDQIKAGDVMKTVTVFEEGL